MAVQCPYCRHELSLKTAPPGMYTTACPDCGRKFYLAVPEDPSAAAGGRAAPVRASSRFGAHPKGQKAAPVAASNGGDAESKAADGPLLTLPEHARPTATLPGPAARAGLDDTAAAPALAGPAAFPGLACGPDRFPVCLDGYLVLQELGGGHGARVPGQASVAQPHRQS